MLCGFFPNCFLFHFRFIVHARIDARSIHSFYYHRSSHETETTLFRFCWFRSKYDRVRRRHAHRYENILSLFSSREPPPVSLTFFHPFSAFTNVSSLNRKLAIVLHQKGTTLSKTDGSRKSPRKCGPDKRTRSRFKKNCTTNKVSFNTCKCSKRQRTGTYSFWTGAYKRRNETSSRIRR